MLHRVGTPGRQWLVTVAESSLTSRTAHIHSLPPCSLSASWYLIRNPHCFLLPAIPSVDCPCMHDSVHWTREALLAYPCMNARACVVHVYQACMLTVRRAAAVGILGERNYERPSTLAAVRNRSLVGLSRSMFLLFHV
jgi:hypothetical protein